MNAMPEATLTRILHDLADGPGPASLADKALAGARGVRRRRRVIAGAALAAAGIIAAPFPLRPAPSPDPVGPATAPIAGSPTTGGPNTGGPNVTVSLAPCAPATQETIDRKRVAESDWPPFVQIAIGRLPQRSDYELQWAWGVCDPGQPEVYPWAPSVEDPAAAKPRFIGTRSHVAYAVINLGPNRESGHLTLNLAASEPHLPDTCDGVRAHVATNMGQNVETPAGEVLFCEDATAEDPMVFGTRYYNVLTVTARYGDGRTVWMESIPAYPDPHHEISAEALRPVVTDRALVDLLPVN